MRRTTLKNDAGKLKNKGIKILVTLAMITGMLLLITFLMTAGWLLAVTYHHVVHITPLILWVNISLLSLFFILEASIWFLKPRSEEIKQANSEVDKELIEAKIKAEILAKEAEESSKAKSNYLATMSHEIRTPLNGVIGMIELLLKSNLSLEQRECAESIRISGEALLAVIHNILDLSKIESDNATNEISNFNIQLLVHDTVEIIAPQLHAKKIAFSAYIDPKVPEWLMGDVNRLRQVLTNLVSNAIKFTNEGRVEIKVSIINDSSNECTLKFEVIDTGLGIAEEDQWKIFQPFQQISVDPNQKYAGTGLGLVICKKIIENMHGVIGFESVLNVGSKFWFVVTLVKGEEQAQATQFKHLAELKNKRLLCLDDNPIILENIKKQTEAWGMICHAVNNYEDAVELISKSLREKNHYTAIFVDYTLPENKGIEFIKVIRSIKEIATTPITLLFSYGIFFNSGELNALSIRLTLFKPHSPRQLYDVIIKSLSNEEKNKPMTRLADKDLKIKRQGIKILLAEDDLVNQDVALRILNKLGYTVDLVRDGQEVLNAIQRVDYDVILMDCKMPKMDGYQVSREIRKLEKGTKKHIIIIAMTAYAFKGDRKKCIDAGMDSYISKPIMIDVVEHRIEYWLKKYSIYRSDLIGEMMSEFSRFPLIDLKRLNDIFGNDPKTIKEFIGRFVEYTNELLLQLESVINKKDSQLAKELFHRLKGSAGNSGIVRIYHLSIKAEEKVIQEDWDAVDKLFNCIKISFIELQDKISHFDRDIIDRLS